MHFQTVQSVLYVASWLVTRSPNVNSIEAPVLQRLNPPPEEDSRLECQNFTHGCNCVVIASFLTSVTVSYLC